MWSLALINFMGCNLVFVVNHKGEPERANKGHEVAFICELFKILSKFSLRVGFNLMVILHSTVPIGYSD